MMDDPASFSEFCAFLRLVVTVVSVAAPLTIPIDLVATDEVVEVRVRAPGGRELRHRVDPESWLLGVLGGLIAGDEAARAD